MEREAVTQQQPTPKEYFRLATHQFPHKGISLNSWKIHDYTGLEGYKEGFRAIAYLNEKTRNMVLSCSLIGNFPISTRRRQTILEHLKEFSTGLDTFAKTHRYTVTCTGFGRAAVFAEAHALEKDISVVIFDDMEQHFN